MFKMFIMKHPGKIIRKQIQFFYPHILYTSQNFVFLSMLVNELYIIIYYNGVVSMNPFDFSNLKNLFLVTIRHTLISEINTMP